jgi:hypothetical protein
MASRPTTGPWGVTQTASSVKQRGHGGGIAVIEGLVKLLNDLLVYL